MRGFLAAIAAGTLSLTGAASAQDTPQDADTAAWWKIIGHLSSDAHEGRDTGSIGHKRAVTWTARALAEAGLRPAGDDGGWLQSVPLNEVRVESEGTSFQVIADGASSELRFLHDISVRADAALPARIEAGLAFRGYCGPDEVGPDVAGRILLCFNARRPGLPSAQDRTAAALAAGAVALINIDDPGYTLEPPRWPEAYARRISIRVPAAAPTAAEPAPFLPTMRLNFNALPKLLAGSGLPAGALLETAMAGAPLAAADLPARMAIRFARSQRSFASDNVLGLLPGTDPALADQLLVVSAHIDAYGFGEPVDGDGLYNGAFDDAAYVAALIRLAHSRAGKGYRRPVLFAIFTGEEKGLLGARWLVEHARPEGARIVADINLDAIRPLFPLKALTLIGLEYSDMVEHVRAVAAPMGVEVRPDMEPIRGMIGRTDAAPFLRAGIPAVSFMFAYDPGSEEEARFRLWYRTRYHKPQDDITQPIDFIAARDFNRFFYALTAQVADADTPPAMTK